MVEDKKRNKIHKKRVNITFDDNLHNLIVQDLKKSGKKFSKFLEDLARAYYSAKLNREKELEKWK